MSPAETPVRSAVVFPTGMPPAPAPAAELSSTHALPLWLTEAEAAVLLELCAASPESGAAEAEQGLFGKLGDLLRAFRR